MVTEDNGIEPLMGTFHDAVTGETVVRELTAEEIAKLVSPPEQSI